ncbi:hypothetical protein KP509_22G026200 [Ceratopteris richardii]|uniref:Uncharacterized protein n=1 Tax=Ceratopteris richardii TaxID=49495 RepID=A0A8T2S647_CERRI|nr:hypothetical protein KP509_22G026200 [Ceratopteris richardii]
MDATRLWACVCVSLVIWAAPCWSKSSYPTSGLNWCTARSLASSLLHRIANRRLSKGDAAGAERINHILYSFDNGLSFWRNIGSIGWDYIIHYSWRNLNPSQVFDIMRLIGDIQSALSEFLQLQTDVDRLRWISLNYGKILQLAKTSLQKLLKLFDQPGALRNFVLSLQTEIMSGGILRDAMELGADDLQSLIQVAKEMLFRYYGQSSSKSSSEL